MNWIRRNRGPTPTATRDARGDAANVDDQPSRNRTAHLTRGAGRLLESQGYSVLTEFRLGNGRRADIAALDRRGTLVIVEVKSSLADFRSDSKWPEYLPYCDRFYFCVSETFPQSALEEVSSLPGETGIIIADAHGGGVLRIAANRPLNAARRKAEILRFARHSAQRLWRFNEDPRTTEQLPEHTL